MDSFGKKFNRARRNGAYGASALLLAFGSPQSGRSQQAAPISTPAVSPQQIMASIKSPTDITPIRDGIRNGVLFRATFPLTEEALRRRDGTPAESSFTVPLMIDRVQNRLSVQALVSGRKVRLILDTGAMPAVSLDRATANGIKVADKVSIQQIGTQGSEPATLGLAKSLTLGKLTLQQIPTSVGGSTPFYSCTLGLSAFKQYRVTLDFAANTMTLTRGGILAAPPGGSALFIPFDDDDGYIFVPVRVLGQAGWALLDSGSDMNSLSFKAAKAAASQIPASYSNIITVNQKIGVGNTAGEFKVIGLKSAVSISMDTTPENAEFNTTSWLGMSSIDDVLDPGLDAHANMSALLGFPFFLQFQRVIIDYPSHTLILQYPLHDTDARVKVAGFATTRDKPWPGYKWLQKGYAWIEVPDVKSAPAASLLPASSTTVTHTTSTTSTTIFTSSDGSVTVTVNGTKIACPPGSTVQVGADGVVHILPPGSSPVK